MVLLFAATALGTIGCGRSDLPELGRVEGTVTLDGKPLAGVVVTFSPQKGRPAVANTDSAGKYDAMYTHGVKGATVGPNAVRVLWPEGEAGTAPIPPKYGTQSELKLEVKPGRNTFDITMQSK